MEIKQQPYSVQNKRRRGRLKIFEGREENADRLAIVDAADGLGDHLADRQHLDLVNRFFTLDRDGVGHNHFADVG